MIGSNEKNVQLLDIVQCLETCKLGLVLLVGGLTGEEQNNVATSLTVRITIKLLTLRNILCVHFTPGLHSGITMLTFDCAPS